MTPELPEKDFGLDERKEGRGLITVNPGWPRRDSASETQGS